MRSNTIFVGTVIALAVVLVIEIWLFATFMSGVSPLAVLLEMSVVMKMAAVVVLLLAMTGVIGGLLREAALAGIVSLLAVAIGLLGAAYGEMNVQAALQAVGPVDFGVTAPDRAQSISLVALGLFVAVMSLGLSRARRTA
ncbi:hypothetical protein [Brevundimonas sp.]|uniref:hypothetical protein n=1 Tax=Brevundimonas sp. TaxID=1871086 RepID=UPI003BAC5C41